MCYNYCFRCAKNIHRHCFTFLNVPELQKCVKRSFSCSLPRKYSALKDVDNPNKPFCPNSFNIKRAAILNKITRYEYEKKVCGSKTEEGLKQYLYSKQSDYHGLLERHKYHHKCLKNITNCLRSAGIEIHVVQRFNLTSELIDWADVIFTAGGDGTFLLAASKIKGHDIPVIGINTDPEGSEGYLCLCKKCYSGMDFAVALEHILAKRFRWQWRQRIRITISGRHMNDDPTKLHDQQLLYPEYRFTEHVREEEQSRQAHLLDAPQLERVLPILALNEVFIAESLSARVSYYEISVDRGKHEKQKSSGVTVCTGTGSSSWHLHINQLALKAVQQLATIAGKVTGMKELFTCDHSVLSQITEEFNRSLRFDPSEPKMGYTIRDPIINGIFQVSDPRGFAERIKLRSRMWDACIVIDGGYSFKFNDGAVAKLEIFEEDALTTVVI